MIPELADRFVGFYTRLILGKPLLTVALLVLVTLLLLKPALTFEQNMTRDIEVYLPEGEESTDLLLEVRQDWATDISSSISRPAMRMTPNGSTIRKRTISPMSRRSRRLRDWNGK